MTCRIRVITDNDDEILQEGILRSREELAEWVAESLMKPDSVITLHGAAAVILIPVQTVRYVRIEDEEEGG